MGRLVMGEGCKKVMVKTLQSHGSLLKGWEKHGKITAFTIHSYMYLLPPNAAS